MRLSSIFALSIGEAGPDGTFDAAGQPDEHCAEPASMSAGVRLMTDDSRFAIAKRLHLEQRGGTLRHVD